MEIGGNSAKPTVIKRLPLRPTVNPHQRTRRKDLVERCAIPASCALQKEFFARRNSPHIAGRHGRGDHFGRYALFAGNAPKVGCHLVRNLDCQGRIRHDFTIAQACAGVINLMPCRRAAGSNVEVSKVTSPSARPFTATSRTISSFASVASGLIEK